MRDYFVSLVEEGIGSLEPDPSRFAEALRRMTEEIRAGPQPLAGQRGARPGGHPRAARGTAPDPGPDEPARRPRRRDHGPGRRRRHPQRGARFSEVLRQRRKQTRGPARLLQQLIGIEAKLRQYEEGERFIAAVEDSGGPRAPRPGVARPGVAALPERDPQPLGVDLPCRHLPGPLGLSRRPAWTAWAGRPPRRRPAGPLHVPSGRGRRWSAGSPAGPTPWPCWSWPWRPAAR